LYVVLENPQWVGLYGGDFYYWANIWIAKEIDQIKVMWIDI